MESGRECQEIMIYGELLEFGDDSSKGQNKPSDVFF